MNKEDKILKQLKALGKGNEETFPAIVENNYPDKDVVDVRDLSGTLYTDVRKRSAVGSPDKGILITPGQNSSVLVSRIGRSDELFIEMFSEVESVVFDNGENGGLTITPELKKQLDKVTARIDAIYNAIRNSAVAPNDGGSTFKTNMITVLSSVTDKEDFSKIENTKIKH